MARRPKSAADNSPTGPTADNSGPSSPNGVAAPTIPPPELPGRSKRPSMVPPAPVEPNHDDISDDDAEEEEDELDISTRRVREQYEEGMGAGVGDPSLMRPGGERPVDLGPVRAEIGSTGRRNEGPLSTDSDEIEPLARMISRFGSTIRVRCRRLYPDDMPPTEMGQSGWMDVPGGETERHDIVRSMIERRFGGGRYEINIADHDPSELAKSVHTTIDIPGDPIPLSSEGRRWFVNRYGMAPAAPTTMDGKPVSSSMGGGIGGDGTMLGVMNTLLQQHAAAADRAMGAVERDKDREVSLVPHLLQFAQSKGTGLQALLPVLPIALEFFRTMREDSRRDREANDRKFEALVAKLSEATKPQTPDAIMAGVNSMLQITTKRAELELQSAQKRNDIILEQMVRQLRESGREEDASFMSTLVGMMRESGPELLRGAMPMLAGMISAGRPPQPGQQALPQPRPMAPRPAAGAPAAPRPAAAPIRTGPVAQAPAAPAEAPPEFQAPPQLPPTPPEAPEEAPPAEPPPAPPMTRPSPQAIADRIAMVSLGNFLSFASAFAQSISDPDAAWAFTDGGNSLETMFGLCPAIFRQRVAETDVDKPFLTEDWVQGAPDEIIELARGLDQLVASSGESRKWLCEFLAIGPWVSDEDEEE